MSVLIKLEWLRNKLQLTKLDAERHYVLYMSINLLHYNYKLISNPKGFFCLLMDFHKTVVKFSMLHRKYQENFYIWKYTHTLYIQQLLRKNMFSRS